MFSKFAFVLMLCAALGALRLSSPRVARADSVITDCSNDSQLTTALVSGGVITFNCGTATITLSSYYFIGVNTTIDGGGKITLSGGNSTRLFWVNSGNSLTLKNIVLTNGYSGAAYGGCIYVNGGTLVVQNSTIQKCSTNGYAGGGIVSPNGNVTLDYVVMKNNSASSGGALSATGTVNISHSQFLNNTVKDDGGALSLAANATIDRSIFTGNTATWKFARGGAIYSSGTLTIHASAFSTNSAWDGGAISMDSGSTLTMDSGSTLSNNSAHTGGGIENIQGVLNLSLVTLNGNTASQLGGGLYVYKAAATLTNATLSGNASTSRAGGIYAETSTLNLVNVTIAGNSAANLAGGVYKYAGGTWTVTNSLFAKGANGGNCYGFGGGSFNLSDDDSCGFGTGRNNVALNLGPLAYNGTSLLTHLPKPGSAAIDNGTNSGAPSIDARTNVRPQNGIVDVGAVEVCTVKPDKPELASPLNNAKHKGTQVALDWDNSLCADKYKVTVKDAATGTKIQGGKSGKSDFKIKALTKGKSYMWYVQACNTIGCTKSDTWKFTVK